MDWEKIVRENARVMLNLAKRIAGCSADAEEIVQDAFLRAYQYQQNQAVNNWGGLLHRFVVQGALDRIRKRKALIRLHASVLANNAADPAELAETKEMVEQFRREICRLPRQQAVVFCLYHLAGKSNGQIAETLAIREGAVATALYKARKQLAAAMAKFFKVEKI